MGICNVSRTSDEVWKYLRRCNVGKEGDKPECGSFLVKRGISEFSIITWTWEPRLIISVRVISLIAPSDPIHTPQFSSKL